MDPSKNEEPVGGVLVLRACPCSGDFQTSVLNNSCRLGGALCRLLLWLASWGRGVEVSLPAGPPGRRRRLIFFASGFGRRVRPLPPWLLAAIREGAITDLVDVGAIGALDPSLLRGDLVWSTGTLACDSLQTAWGQRRESLRPCIRAIAERRRVRLWEAPILTHHRVVGSRRARLDLHRSTGCAAVEMEHAWMLLNIRERLGPQRFGRLAITHLGVVTDTGPQRDGLLPALREIGLALSLFFPWTWGGVGRIRGEFLQEWLRLDRSPAR